MKLGWLFILLVPVILLFAWIGAAHDARQQTVFLERTADRLEKTRAIPSETERRIQQTVESIRARVARGDDRIEARKKRAIERIEAAFAARSLESVTGRIPRGIPALPGTGGGSADERQQTARARR